MKTEDIDKRIGMPDVDAEWEKFEQEVIDKETASNKRIILWGLSIAASIALVAGIFFLGNTSKQHTDKTVAKIEQPAAPDNHEEATTVPETKVASENDIVSEDKTILENKTEPETVHQPVGEMLAMAPSSNTEGKKEDNSTNAVEEPVKQEQIFSVVEQSPSFPGGHKALQEFIKTNLRYPELAMEYGAKGRVIMTFVVDSVGHVRDIKVFTTRLSYDTLRLNQETVEKQEQVKEQIAQQLGEESTRILSLMPRWSPGKAYGRTRNVRYTQPVQFP